LLCPLWPTFDLFFIILSWLKFNQNVLNLFDIFKYICGANSFVPIWRLIIFDYLVKLLIRAPRKLGSNHTIGFLLTRPEYTWFVSSWRHWRAKYQSSQPRIVFKMKNLPILLISDHQTFMACHNESHSNVVIGCVIRLRPFCQTFDVIAIEIDFLLMLVWITWRHTYKTGIKGCCWFLFVCMILYLQRSSSY
jgi:hypothetical protein